jgi:hemoglobin-like flavoprotein
MTPDQIDDIRRSFALVAEDADRLARAFYRNLFDVAPGVRPLFPTDLSEQRTKLLRELSRIVAGASDPDRLVARLRKLGERHVDYGAEPAHYPVVGAVLLDTLAEILGDDFTGDVRDAWSAAYTLVAGVMLGAAREAQTARASAAA